MRVCFSGQEFDLDDVVDISLPIRFDREAGRAFSLPGAKTAPVEGGGFVGAVKRGGSCNCATHSLTPHGDGTHTEGPGHISADAHTVRPPPALLLCALIHVTPRPLEASLDDVAGNHRHDDLVVDVDLLDHALAAAAIPPEVRPEAVVVVTGAGWATRDGSFSGTNPPYLTPDATAYLRARGFAHLLVDLPSVDREDDGGLLSAHHAFFEVPRGLQRDLAAKLTTHDAEAPGNPGGTITELCAVDVDVPAGLYVLNLQVAAVDADAAPSRPLLYPVNAAAVPPTRAPAKGPHGL